MKGRLLRTFKLVIHSISMASYVTADWRLSVPNSVGGGGGGGGEQFL